MQYRRLTGFGFGCVCAGAVLLAVLAGCSNSSPSGAAPSGAGTSAGSGNSGMMGGSGPGGSPGSGSGGGSPGGGQGGMYGGSTSNSGNYSSIGEQIYLSGVGGNGNDVPRTAPRISQGSLMMGGGGCGSCHAANGKGGTIRMMSGTAIKAPDITYYALAKAGFTDVTIRQAIRDGLDESGKKLDIAMPRWQMNDADADETIAYLKVLGTK